MLRHADTLLQLILCAALSSSVGCGDRQRDEAQQQEPARPRTPVTIPTPPGLLAEGELVRASDVLASVQAYVGQRVATHTGDFLNSVCDLPQGVAARIADNTPLRFVVLRSEWGTPAFVYAARMRVDGGGAPLGPETRVVAGAPGGASYVDPVNSRSPSRVALRGQLLVCAANRRALDDGLLYATRDTTSSHTQPGAYVHVPERTLQREGARMIRNALEDAFASDTARAWLDNIIEVIPDIGDVDAEVHVTASDVVLTATLAIDDRSHTGVLFSRSEGVAPSLLARFDSETSIGVVASSQAVAQSEGAIAHSLTGSLDGGTLPFTNDRLRAETIARGVALYSLWWAPRNPGHSATHEELEASLHRGAVDNRDAAPSASLTRALAILPSPALFAMVAHVDAFTKSRHVPSPLYVALGDRGRSVAIVLPRESSEAWFAALGRGINDVH